LISEVKAEALKVIEAREETAIEEGDSNELEGVDLNAVNEEPVLQHL
jgi:hypothetical protein